MAVAETTVFWWYDIEAIVRNIILTDPEAKCLFGIDDCSLHREPLFVFGLLREPMILQLACENSAHWTAIGS